MLARRRRDAHSLRVLGRAQRLREGEATRTRCAPPGRASGARDRALSDDEFAC
jgi:hypothetical protein